MFFTDEDLDVLDTSVIFTSTRRTRGKQIDFVAVMERERLERSSGGLGSATGSSVAAAVVEEEEEDEDDDEFVGEEE